MNLLITGGCGFIASNFINHYFLNENLKTITNLDAMYYCANEQNVNNNIRSSDKYNMVKGNICDVDLVDYILRKYNITHVIHFAAQSHVQNSFNDSKQYVQDNIVGTHTLLECCRLYGKIEKFIHVSTDEVYGESMLDKNEKQKTEQSVLCPSNPYAATKAGAELIAQSYYHSFKMPIIITRGNNVYGPNQYPEKLIPKFIELLTNDKKVTIQGDGSNVRAFLHVNDTVSAFACILEKGKIGEIYNIGCDEGMEYSVLDIAKMLIKLIKNTENYDDWIEYIEDRPFNDKRYYISNEKVKELGWEITINFEDGITNLIKYYNLIYNNIYCYTTPKSGGTSLNITLNGLHVHSSEYFNKYIIDKKYLTVFNCIEKSSMIHDEIYIIDVYRNPIERNLSNICYDEPDLFEEIKDYNLLNDMINEKCIFKNTLSIEELLEYFNISLPYEFDHINHYIHFKHRNINFLILDFNYLNTCESIIKKILNKDVKLLKSNENLNNNYNIFKRSYKAPKIILDYIKNDFKFKYFNSNEEQIKYLQFWEKNTDEESKYLKIPDDFDPAIYRFLNQDLIEKNDLELRLHWSLHSERDNRVYKL